MLKVTDKNRALCHCERGTSEATSSPIHYRMHWRLCIGDEFASSLRHACPAAPRNDIFFISATPLTNVIPVFSGPARWVLAMTWGE